MYDTNSNSLRIMCEIDPIGDDFEENEVFVPLRREAGLPIIFNGHLFRLGPDNSAIRSFDEARADYTRVIVYLEDGTSAPFKPEDRVMQDLAHLGVPIELPEKLDETDREFMEGYMQVWTEDAGKQLGL